MAKMEQSTQVHTRTGIVTTAGTILNEFQDRREVIIQNLGTNPLFVKFGNDASVSDFDVILSGGTANDDGIGEKVSYNYVSYVGAISVAGTSVRCTATEF